MEQNHSRLRATLVAGNIPVTDETLSTLSAGLSTIGHGYHIEKVIRGEGQDRNPARERAFPGWCGVPHRG